MRTLLLLPALVLLALVPPGVARADAAPGFRWPLAGAPTVDRGFAPPRTAWGAGHRGVDLPAAWDVPVLAAGPGRVTYAGLLAGRGVVVVAHAAGLRTTYEPVAAAVRVGQEVAGGDVLGTLTSGHASCRTGVVCLHWGLLRGDTYLDPLLLLRHAGARLLPLRPQDRSPSASDAGTPGAPAASEGARTAVEGDRPRATPAPRVTSASGARRSPPRSPTTAAGVALVLGAGALLLRHRPTS